MIKCTILVWCFTICNKLCIYFFLHFLKTAFSKNKQTKTLKTSLKTSRSLFPLDRVSEFFCISIRGKKIGRTDGVLLYTYGIPLHHPHIIPLLSYDGAFSLHGYCMQLPLNSSPNVCVPFLPILVNTLCAHSSPQSPFTSYPCFTYTGVIFVSVLLCLFFCVEAWRKVG